jgi:hypothetical protein
MVRRTKPDLSLAKLRSAITNGRHLLADVDQRSAKMRRYRDLIESHITQLGGADRISESELRLVRRCAMLSLQAELMDSRFAQAETSATPFDLDLYQRLTNTLRRTLEGLGLQRRTKDVTPSVADYVRSINGEADL